MVSLLIPLVIASFKNIIEKMQCQPTNFRFTELIKICKEFFGEPRQTGTSHTVYFKMPWQGDPRVNIQNNKGKAKAYQVRQVLLAIDKLKEGKHER